MTYPIPDLNRRRWCASLAKLVSPAFPADATKALVDMLPAMQHLPEVLFCDATLSHVAMAKRRQSVPAFDDIVSALQDYRQTYVHEPRRALPAPRFEGRNAPDDAEQRHVRGVIEGLMQDLVARRVEQEAMDSGPVLRPMADVTAKGAELARIRGKALERTGASATDRER